MAKYGLEKAEIRDLVKEREHAVDIDDIFEGFKRIVEEIKKADASRRRAELILDACKQFYLEGYYDGLAHYNEAIMPGLEEPEEIPDEDEEEEESGYDLEDLGL